MRICTLVAAFLVVPMAFAQPASVRAPDVTVKQQPIAAYGGPSMWIGPDLFMLGRPSDVEDSSVLWFWSRAKGVFEVKLPDAARPERDTLCAKEGALQWLEPVKEPRKGPASERRLYKLFIEPLTGAARLDDSTTAHIGVVQSFGGGSDNPFFQERDAILYFATANCRMMKSADFVEGIRNAIPTSGHRWEVELGSDHGFRVRVQTKPSDPTDPFNRTYQISYLSWDFKPITSEEAFPVRTNNSALGTLRYVDLGAWPDPFMFQLQLTGADGKIRSLMSAAPNDYMQQNLSPDGCAVFVTTFKSQRTDPNRPLGPVPPGPPPSKNWPLGLGRALKGNAGVMIDLCSPENRALIEKPL